MPCTDEEAALQAISSFATADSLSKAQQEAQRDISGILSSDDPFIDIHELFKHFNALYFRDLLVPRVEVSWRPKLTVCAGICELIRDPKNDNKYTRIRLKLSEALLKYRPRSDVVDTLLHEAIHAYFFVTTDWKHNRGDDGTGHGNGFLLMADAINAHGGYNISIYHTFHDEIDAYRKHIWQCNGVCKERAPYFGLVKRSMNRPPAKNDLWWAEHQKSCGGAFTKISEPEPTRDQIQRMRPLERAGRQKNKIDNWVLSSATQSSMTAKNELEANIIPLPDDTGESERQNEGSSDITSINNVACPICAETISLEDINHHLDNKH